jgi:tetratricopeptide (TPR) repeat protein
MKKKLALALLLSTSLFATELTSLSIRKAYYDSYELEKQERYEEASTALEHISKAYPQGYTVNYRRAWLAYLNGNYADAQKFYSTALIQYPNSLEARKGMLLVEVARQEWKDVEKQARAGRNIDYFNLNFTYWQAVALRVQGQNANAIKILEEISALYPTNTNFLVELVDNKLTVGDKNEALLYLEAVIILDPYNPKITELTARIDNQ